MGFSGVAADEAGGVGSSGDFVSGGVGSEGVGSPDSEGVSVGVSEGLSDGVRDGGGDCGDGLSDGLCGVLVGSWTALGRLVLLGDGSGSCGPSWGGWGTLGRTVGSRRGGRYWAGWTEGLAAGRGFSAGGTHSGRKATMVPQQAATAATAMRLR